MLLPYTWCVTREEDCVWDRVTARVYSRTHV
nr:MAG TPA: hypothetical protein [Caudoviricetes sp.]